MSGEWKNEGEGSRSGAKAYDEKTENFAKSGKVDKAAQDAKKAVEGSEGEQLRKAEEEGKRHSRGEDPALNKKG